MKEVYNVDSLANIIERFSFSMHCQKPDTWHSVTFDEEIKYFDCNCCRCECLQRLPLLEYPGRGWQGEAAAQYEDVLKWSPAEMMIRCQARGRWPVGTLHWTLALHRLVRGIHSTDTVLLTHLIWSRYSHIYQISQWASLRLFAS